jgi:hypothetical protein
MCTIVISCRCKAQRALDFLICLNAGAVAQSVCCVLCGCSVQVTEMFEQLSTMVVDSTQASVSDLADKQQQVGRPGGTLQCSPAGCCAIASPGLTCHANG